MRLHQLLSPLRVSIGSNMTITALFATCYSKLQLRSQLNLGMKSCCLAVQLQKNYILCTEHKLDRWGSEQ